MAKASSVLENISPRTMTFLVLFASFLALMPAWIHYDIIARDGAHLYVPVARLFYEGRFHDAIFSIYQPLFPIPLYELLIALVARVSGFSLELSGRLISAAGFIIGSLGIYKISFAMAKSRTVGILSVLLYLSNKKLLDISVDCLKESLLVCLVVWGNYLVVKSFSSQVRALYLISGMGILFLAGFMIRSTSLIFLGAWLLVWIFHSGRGLLPKLLLIFVIPLSIAIWLGYAHPEVPIFRRSLSVHIYFNLAHAYNNTLEIANAGLLIVRQFLSKSYYFVGFMGFMGMLYYRKDKYAQFVFIMFVSFFIALLGTGWNYTDSNSDRYLMAPVVCFIPLSGYAIATFANRPNFFLKWMALLTIIICPLLWADTIFQFPDPDKLARKEAGQWTLSRVGPHNDILTNRERIAFYAQGNDLELIEEKAFDHMRKIVAVRYPAGSYVRLYEITDLKTLKKVIAIDTQMEEGLIWKRYLDTLDIKPDRSFRSIYVYLPKFTMTR
jgi:hypothetical protein